MLLGNLNGGLFTVHNAANTEPVAKQSSAMSSHSSDAVKLWHMRLGHLPFPQLKIIKPSCSISECMNSIICQICPAARQCRKSFPHSSIKTSAVLEMLHIDIWGPYKSKTYTHCNSFLTIVDDFSRYTWVHLLKAKSEVASVLECFVNYAEKQFKSKVLCIRSDNALELTEGTLKQFYLRKGIVNQTSCVHTPQQNGVVERKHRHLLETARALFLQSKLPDRYWGESILCATYLINRMPLSSLGNVTPYSILYREDPDYDILRTFGCLCYVSTLKVQRSKFQPRAEPGIFLGYPPNQKGYKVLNLNTNQVIVSRDVTFHEFHFPFHLHSTTDHYSTSIFLPTVTPVKDYFDPPISPQPTQPPSTSTQSQSSNTVTPPPDRPVRVRHTPAYLKDYHCHIATNGSICNLVSSENFNSTHTAQISQLCNITEPSSYKEASTDPIWVEAMNTELKALENNHTWDLVSLPPGKKCIGSKWVYRVKLKSDGSLERCKARLVAKGFNQRYGIDYEETFSPVVKMNTIRCLIALAASRKWDLFQLDVNNAFLHGDLKQEVYMTPPSGLNVPSHLVCRLIKTIYGLKQSSREWFDKLHQELTSQGFIQSKNDYSLFIKRTGSLIAIMAVYVDDIILTGTDLATITHIKAHLHSVFGIKDLGLLHYFLGIEVGYYDNGITLSQQKFTRELLKDCPFVLPRRASTPLPLNLKLTADSGTLFKDPELYRSYVGKLNYLTNTRPDLSYAVQVLSQFLQSPRIPHFEALLHTLQYVSTSPNNGILLCASDSLVLQAYSDSDWASCPMTRRSITGYALLLGGSPIAWKSKKQATISRSSSESEYRAMASAAAEVTWTVRLLEELGLTNLKPITLHCDSQSAIHIARNPVFHERTKHIDIDCHFTRDKVLEGLLQLTYLPTQNQLADAFTKILPLPQFQHLLSKLGMYSTPSSLRGGIETDTSATTSATCTNHIQASKPIPAHTDRPIRVC